MKAEIIAIGSELTCGARLDTNSQWLSLEMEARGWTVHRHTTIGDDKQGLIQCYRDAAKRSRVVLVTGGLGPTLDDITRETLAAAFDRPLIQDDDALAHIVSLFASRGREMPERNVVQALRPDGADSIHNAHGTAPGIHLALSDPDCAIIVMPGVPSEMKSMFHERVCDLLPQSPQVVTRALIRTFGIGESDVERRLGDLTARDRNPEVGITASNAVITLSITARAESEEACRTLTDDVSTTIKETLGSVVFGEGELDVHHAVGELLVEHNIRVALLEGTVTGGLISQWMTATDELAAQVGTSRISSEPQAPEAWLDHAQSEAEQLLKDGIADFVIATSARTLVETDGVRRLDGLVAVIGTGVKRSKDVSMTGNLAIFRERAGRAALNELRLQLSAAAD